MKALVSYLTKPLRMSDEELFCLRRNRWRAREIPRILEGLGYDVKVVHWKNTSFIPDRDYDLFIGHGGYNFEQIARHISGAKIYFSTGSYWRFHNQEERKRFESLERRRGVRLPFDRHINEPEESALRIADGIIAMGNDFTRQTYADFPRVITVNDSTAYDPHRPNRDYDAGRQHFLYYGGLGPVHKGLDLALDAFMDLGQHLWVCTRVSKSFAGVYRDAFARANIHLVGWIQLRGERFYEMMDRCNYVILPSCSEGQPGSVLECMGMGLIPITTPACGVDAGEVLDPCTIEEIQSTASTLSARPVPWHKRTSEAIEKVAFTKHSDANFTREFTDAVRALI